MNQPATESEEEMRFPLVKVNLLKTHKSFLWRALRFLMVAAVVFVVAIALISGLDSKLFIAGSLIAQLFILGIFVLNSFAWLEVGEVVFSQGRMTLYNKETSEEIPLINGAKFDLQEHHLEVGKISIAGKSILFKTYKEERARLAAFLESQGLVQQ